MLAMLPPRSVALGLVLLAFALATRLDVARNRGFHPNLARSLGERAAAAHEERASTKYRYHNANTKSRSNLWTRNRAITNSNCRVLRRVSAGYPPELHDGDVQWPDSHQRGKS